MLVALIVFKSVSSSLVFTLSLSLSLSLNVFCMLQSFACHEYNEVLHKDAAIIILKVLTPEALGSKSLYAIFISFVIATGFSLF
jgi:hypothetical protein